MPSWNIHIAHVERLLREEGAQALGVQDTNAFLVGNLLPDILVGYMVPHTTQRIDYKMTHFAGREHIPVPRADIFWDLYIEEQGQVSDVVLGAWAHLTADHVYNTHTRRFLHSHRIDPGEQARIGKQSDFAQFGHTLNISTHMHADQALLDTCQSFPPYSLAATDVRAAVEVANHIVDTNTELSGPKIPIYQLLTAEFFESAWEDTHVAIRDGLYSYKDSLAQN